MEERTLLSSVPFGYDDFSAASQPVILEAPEIVLSADEIPAAAPEVALGTIPAEYCANDAAHLRDFLEQTNKSGKKNGALVSSTYDSDDPSTWNVTWVETESGKRVSEINWGYYSLIGSLNLSGCESLCYLNCGWNRMTGLDVSGCTSLETLVCCENQLQSLDVSENPALKRLDCWNNKIEKLDVSNNTELTYLVCFGNELTRLDVSKNDSMKDLWFWNTDLTAVALSQTAFDDGLNVGLYGSQTTWTCLNDQGEAVLSGIDATEPFTLSAFPSSLVADYGDQVIGLAETFVQLDAPVLNQPSVSARKVSVSWSEVPNATGYVMEYWATDDEEIRTKTVTGTSAQFNGNYGDEYIVRVMAVGTGFWTESEYSAETNIQIPNLLDGVTLSASELEVGDTLTASVLPAGATAEWQWFRGEDLIEDATESSYTVTFDDVGYSLKCQATGTGQYTGTVTSAATEMVRGALTTPTLSLQPGNYEVQVTLGAVAKAPGYLVEYSQDYGFANSQSVEFDSAGVHAISGLEHDKIYYFRVRAAGSESTGTYDSGWSVVKSACNFGTSEVKSAPTIVTTNLDVVDAYDGIISLREALSYAPAGATITFDESMRDQTITLDGSRLEVLKKVNILAGDHNITIDADGQSSVMYVNAISTIQGLTFINGWSAGNTSAGVQVNSGTVTITGCEFRGNVTESSSTISGAAVYLNKGATLRLENTIIAGNTDLTSNSAAIFSSGKLTMVTCEVSQNDAAGVFGLVNPMNIVNCSIVGNSHQGINCTAVPKTTITNSIVSGNLDYDVQGKCTLTNSIAGNIETAAKPTLKKSQTGIRNPGFEYFPDFANYEEWLNACEEDWDLTLTADSPAINQGDSKLLTSAGSASDATDLAGNRRTSLRVVDIGAYEFQFDSIDSPEVSACIDGKNVYVSWELVDGAVSYNVDYRIKGAAKWTSRKNLKTNFMTFAAKAGTTYEVCVSAISGNLALDDSAPGTTTVTCTQTLANPKLKVDYKGDDNAKVSVTGLAAGATHLLVKLGEFTARIPTSGGSADFGTAQCTYENGLLTFTELENNTKYALEVQQMIDEPGLTLVRSAAVKNTIQTTKACYNTPQNVTAATLSDTQVEVGWSTVTGKKSDQEAAFYTVQYSLAGKNKWTNASVKATGNSFVVTKLKGGTSYEFRVFASKDNSFLASDFSAPATAETLPAAPVIASVTTPAAQKALMTWNKAAGIQSYEIRYCIKGTNDWQTVEVPVENVAKMSYTFTDLTSRSAYEFQIRSIDAKLNTSAWSASKVLAKVK